MNMAALAYLTGTATQGSADAFVEAEIATALQGLSNVAFRVRELLFELPNVGNATGGPNIEAAISRRSKAAMPNITDRDVIAKIFHQANFTTSGAMNMERVRRLTFTEDDELLIVEDPVYLDVDSNATSAANTVRVRIGYERASISAVDRLTLLTQSLE